MRSTETNLWRALSRFREVPTLFAVSRGADSFRGRVRRSRAEGTTDGRTDGRTGGRARSWVIVGRPEGNRSGPARRRRRLRRRRRRRRGAHFSRFPFPRVFSNRIDRVGMATVRRWVTLWIFSVVIVVTRSARSLNETGNPSTRRCAGDAATRPWLRCRRVL